MKASAKRNAEPAATGSGERSLPGTKPLPEPPPRRTLGDLLEGEDDSQSAAKFSSARTLPKSVGATIAIDDGKTAVAGIRKLVGTHLTLYTDLPSQPAVDELPAVFDAAVPLWCGYFETDPLDVADWHVTGFLIQEKDRFVGTGLFPADLPPFRNGYQRGRYIWVYDQPDDY
ncbi:MAG: hypothetical protein JJ992_02940, partial [Planctomycetes bacterium]|nr:hypothetical protein [Planctomycetota bacterium]